MGKRKGKGKVKAKTVEAEAVEDQGKGILKACWDALYRNKVKAKAAKAAKAVEAEAVEDVEDHYFFGLDFGTSTSLICVVKGTDGEPTVIHAAESKGVEISSQVYVHSPGNAAAQGNCPEWALGSFLAPRNLEDSKSLIGRTGADYRKKESDAKENLRKHSSLKEKGGGSEGMLKTMFYNVPTMGKKNANVDPKTVVVLRLLRAAEKKGYIVRKVMLTAPVYFSSQQRQALIDVVESLRVKVVQVIPEPYAVAVSINKLQPMKGSYLLLTLDVGGGTTDGMALLVDGQEEKFVAVAQDGVGNLGGNAARHILAEHCLTKLGLADEGLDDHKARTPETYKILNEIDKQLPCMTKLKGLRFQVGESAVEVSAFDCHRLLKPLYNRIASVATGLLDQAKSIVEGKGEKNMQVRVVLAGGGSGLPHLMATVKKRLSEEVSWVDKGAITVTQHPAPQHAIVMGAAIEGARRAHPNPTWMVDAMPVPNNVYLETANGQGDLIFQRNSKITTESGITAFREYTNDEAGQREMVFRMYTGNNAPNRTRGASAQSTATASHSASLIDDMGGGRFTEQIKVLFDPPIPKKRSLTVCVELTMDKNMVVKVVCTSAVTGARAAKRRKTLGVTQEKETLSIQLSSEHDVRALGEEIRQLEKGNQACEDVYEACSAFKHVLATSKEKAAAGDPGSSSGEELELEAAIEAAEAFLRRGEMDFEERDAMKEKADKLMKAMEDEYSD